MHLARPGSPTWPARSPSPRRRRRAITLAILLLVPGYWSLVTGLVAEGSNEESAPFAAPYIAFGRVLLPFVFLALAFLSEHPRASGATAWALVLTNLVGAPVSAFAGDAVTGFVAGVGAGGIAAMRAGLAHSWKARAVAVLWSARTCSSSPVRPPSSRCFSLRCFRSRASG
jgi:hypothetical protein